MNQPAASGISGASEATEASEGSAPDYRTLLAYARRRTAAAIAGYAGIGRTLFGREKGDMTDRERSLMTSLLRQLVAETEATILRAVAGAAVNGSGIAPERKIIPRADSFERIAAAGLLQDHALIEAAQHRMGEFQLECAIRKRLGGRWSGADAADESGTVDALAGGAGQLVRSRLGDYMVARSARIDAYENPLLPLTELDRDAAQRLYWNVAAVLRPTGSEPGEDGYAAVDEALERAVASALAALRAEGVHDSRAGLAAQALADAGRLDAALVVEALRRGEVQLSVVMFSRLAGLRQGLAYRLMFEPGGIGLAIACRAVGMTQMDFGDFYLLTRNVSDGADRNAGEEFDDMMSWFDRLPQDEADKVVSYWRRPAGYLRALWLHEQAEKEAARRDG